MLATLGFRIPRLNFRFLECGGRNAGITLLHLQLNSRVRVFLIMRNSFDIKSGFFNIHGYDIFCVEYSQYIKCSFEMFIRIILLRLLLLKIDLFVCANAYTRTRKQKVSAHECAHMHTDRIFK